MLSEKEQAVLNFIKEKEGVTIKEIEEGLSKSHVGAMGTLIRNNLIEKYKVKSGEGYNLKLTTKYRVTKGE